MGILRDLLGEVLWKRFIRSEYRPSVFSYRTWAVKPRRLGRGYEACLCFVSIFLSIPSQDLWAGSPKVTPAETRAAL
jgi:hypothetical protein